MRCLIGSLKEEAIIESKDLGVQVSTYEKMWFAVYTFVVQVCKPTPKLIRDIIRVCAGVAMNTDLCSLNEEQRYSEQFRELKYLIDKEGIRSTDIKIVQREAEEPPSPTNIFHLKYIEMLIASTMLPIVRYLYLKKENSVDIYGQYRKANTHYRQ